MLLKVHQDSREVQLSRSHVQRSTAVFYASVSASFIIEQEGLPIIEADGGSLKLNGDSPTRRLSELQHRAGLSGSTTTRV